MKNSIKLQTDSVLQIPLQKYVKDFTFIINSERFETSSFIADLISPIISSRHLIDPTLNEFIINTKTRGDFNKIINLINFKPYEINDDDSQFIIDIFDQLGTEKVEVNLKQEKQISNDNIFDQLIDHQKHPKFYKKELAREIEYFTSHFYELIEKILEKIKDDEFDLDDDLLESIISNNQLVLEAEDDLLEIINELYLKDRKYSKFYEFVDFRNVEPETMKYFIDLFDIKDLTISMWTSICDRLEQQIVTDELENNRKSKHEYLPERFITEIATKTDEFDGILNYFQTHSKIKDEVNIVASSTAAGDVFNLLRYENKSIFLRTNNVPNSWVCFEFKNHTIAPSSYIIRSYPCENHYHLKSWIFEGSDDNKNWIILDEQKNNAALNGAGRVHSFPVSNKSDQKAFKFLRLRQTGPNWCDNNDTYHYLMMNSIEFYGKII